MTSSQGREGIWVQLRKEWILYGVVSALLWVNVYDRWFGSGHSYHDWWDKELWVMPEFFHHDVVTPHWLVNDVLMVVFFLIVGKEIREAFIKGGAFIATKVNDSIDLVGSAKKAALPVFATAGGILGPRFMNIELSARFLPELGEHWLIPTATDIALAAVFLKIIFGAGHAAYTYLMTVAILDDAFGVGAIPVRYSDGLVYWQVIAWIMFTVAMSYALRLLGRKFTRSYTVRVLGRRGWRVMNVGLFDNIGWYLLLTTASWAMFLHLGVHTTMCGIALLFGMEHSGLGKRPEPGTPEAEDFGDQGLFSKNEPHQNDLLNRFEHFFLPGYQVVLLAFGLANAGAPLDSIGRATGIITASLLLGKPIGIILATAIGIYVFRLKLPEGMTMFHVAICGIIAGIGFTVSIFVTTLTGLPTDLQNHSIVGATLSFVAGGLALFASRFGNIEWTPEERTHGAEAHTQKADQKDPVLV